MGLALAGGTGRIGFGSLYLRSNRPLGVDEGCPERNEDKAVHQS
jgi:hypothetical protein